MRMTICQVQHQQQQKKRRKKNECEKENLNASRIVFDSAFFCSFVLSSSSRVFVYVYNCVCVCACALFSSFFLVECWCFVYSRMIVRKLKCMCASSRRAEQIHPIIFILSFLFFSSSFSIAACVAFFFLLYISRIVIL